MTVASTFKSIYGRLLGIDALTGSLWGKAQSGLTALAGGGQTNALELPAFLNRVTTVATAADSVKLPPARAGVMVFVANAAAANSMNVFPQTGDAINALSANASYGLAANKAAFFVCCANGVWTSVLTA